jgi:hypothetical protein
MYRTLKSPRTRRILYAALLAGLFVGAGVGSAAAQSGAFVQQLQGGALHAENLLTSLSHIGGTAPHGYAPSTPIVAPTSVGQQLANPAVGNFAASFSSGVGNHIVQMQSGKGNYSAAAIVGGRQNNVGVLQEGNDLYSQVVLANTGGLNVGVIQPPNSAPVSLFIARLPNGALLIKR